MAIYREKDPFYKISKGVTIGNSTGIIFTEWFVRGQYYVITKERNGIYIEPLRMENMTKDMSKEVNVMEVMFGPFKSPEGDDARWDDEEINWEEQRQKELKELEETRAKVREENKEEVKPEEVKPKVFEKRKFIIKRKPQE